MTSEYSYWKVIRRVCCDVMPSEPFISYKYEAVLFLDVTAARIVDSWSGDGLFLQPDKF